MSLLFKASVPTRLATHHHTRTIPSIRAITSVSTHAFARGLGVAAVVSAAGTRAVDLTGRRSSATRAGVATAYRKLFGSRHLHFSVPVPAADLSPVAKTYDDDQQAVLAELLETSRHLNRLRSVKSARADGEHGPKGQESQQPTVQAAMKDQMVKREVEQSDGDVELDPIEEEYAGAVLKRDKPPRVTASKTLFFDSEYQEVLKDILADIYGDNDYSGEYNRLAESGSLHQLGSMLYEACITQHQMETGYYHDYDENEQTVKITANLVKTYLKTYDIQQRNTDPWTEEEDQYLCRVMMSEDCDAPREEFLGDVLSLRTRRECEERWRELTQRPPHLREQIQEIERCLGESLPPAPAGQGGGDGVGQAKLWKVAEEKELAEVEADEELAMNMVEEDVDVDAVNDHAFPNKSLRDETPKDRLDDVTSTLDASDSTPECTDRMEREQRPYWTIDEDRELIKLRKFHGLPYSDISRLLHGRTPTACQQRLSKIKCKNPGRFESMMDVMTEEMEAENDTETLLESLEEAENDTKNLLEGLEHPDLTGQGLGSPWTLEAKRELVKLRIFHQLPYKDISRLFLGRTPDACALHLSNLKCEFPAHLDTLIKEIKEELEAGCDADNPLKSGGTTALALVAKQAPNKHSTADNTNHVAASHLANEWTTLHHLHLITAMATRDGYKSEPIDWEAVAATVPEHDALDFKTRWRDLCARRGEMGQITYNLEKMVDKSLPGDSWYKPTNGPNDILDDLLHRVDPYRPGAPWSVFEDLKLVKHHVLQGQDWSQVRWEFEDRTYDAVRMRYSELKVHKPEYLALLIDSLNEIVQIAEKLENEKRKYSGKR
ncbi:hypothetical protein DFJ77DRAFT_546349 [Powellomyces hirtus]|nr:hypothetical protein DFJ77DRAFT_546349 [Powellomyces hirtus]